MSGFSGYYLKNNKYENYLAEFKFPNLIADHFHLKKSCQYNNVHIAWYSHSKFIWDKGLEENDNLIYGFEGVDLNFFKQESKINEKFLKEIIETTFSNHVSNLSGSFQGVCYFKSNHHLYFYTDYTNSKPIFRYENDDILAFSSSLIWLNQFLNKLKISTTLDINSAYQFLSLGYFADQSTLVKEIKKELPSLIRKVTLDKNSEYQIYHVYQNETKYTKITENIIRQTDELFQDVIKKEYNKDLQYGLKHITTLSGGLDSRINVISAHKQNFNNFTNITFSQSGSDDEKIARKISEDFKDQHILLSLNNGVHLFENKNVIQLNNCSVYFFGAAQTYYSNLKINFDSFGLLHHGALAESSKGGYLKQPNVSKPNIYNWGVSTTFIDKIKSDLLNNANQYANDEIFALYTRGFNAIQNGTWMSTPFTDLVYTYMEKEFASYAYSIDPKLRYNGRFTIEWMKLLHPEMTKYNWHYQTPPTNNELKILLARIIYKLKRTSGLIKTQSAFPIQNWLKENHALRSNLENSYKELIDWSIFPSELKKDLNLLHNNGTIQEQLLSVNLLIATSLLFQKDN